MRETQISGTSFLDEGAQTYLGKLGRPTKNLKVFIDGIIGSIPCSCIECITAFVPPALIVPFNSDLEIYPFVTSHEV